MDGFPEKLKAGQPVEKNWRAVNELLDKVKTQAAELRRLNDLVRERILGPQFKESGGGEQGVIKMFRVEEVRDDYLVCNDMLGTADSLQNVAKAWRLRRKPFDGLTIDFVDERNQPYSAFYTHQTAVRRTVRISTPGSTLTLEESQVVVPKWKPVFDFIFASKTQKTGVIVDSVELTWQDINADGRAWARER